MCIGLSVQARFKTNWCWLCVKKLDIEKDNWYQLILYWIQTFIMINIWFSKNMFHSIGLPCSLWSWAAPERAMADRINFSSQWWNLERHPQGGQQQAGAIPYSHSCFALFGGVQVFQQLSSSQALCSSMGQGSWVGLHCWARPWSYEGPPGPREEQRHCLQQRLLEDVPSSLCGGEHQYLIQYFCFLPNLLWVWTKTKSF